MNVLKTALLAAASMTVASAAFAADPIMPAPTPIVPVVDDSSVWDGFYAGVNAGYGWGEFDDGALTTDIEGWLGGAQLGYNAAFGGVVVGVEGDYQFSDIKEGDLGINHFGTVRGRIGADLGGFLPYITGGIAFGELDNDIDDAEYGWGWAAGAGVEAMVMDNLSVKGEYLYTSFNEVEFDAGDADAEAHIARVGLNFHF
ncbi:outer membrane beta-barrel protein [Pelagibacterium sp. 26DY04]|uniref:outer membrane protein n=1 Tax=Pelagibacterium sp. 26DY04 TaxID=2967130 RepID=UPI002814E23F|nr:outer membrane beta-barrel protein [Pelagibacterium sp. 26DY04]WMT88672.1 outer membrane beta-barrel protein [Pelagibacterium sp. 26DY04]